MKIYTVSWFSAGVSSAVATKIAIEDIDEIIYTHIEDQHPDTKRFLKDCEIWFGKKITILHSEYGSVERAVRGAGGCGYINGVYGAACTKILKRRVRRDWEKENADKGRFCYVWGLDASEGNRVDRIEDAMPEVDHKFPLVEKGIHKEEAHEILKASGIKRPAMYELGYRNNNCIGCVKGGMGYWNKIRVDFPDVFDARAKLERLVGASCINGVYLDELDPSKGKDMPPIVGECGLMCELQALK